MSTAPSEIPAARPNPWDNWRVRLDLQGEVMFWTTKLQCSDDELFRAVAERGAVAKDVAAFLREQRRGAAQAD
ncbi:MAG TPA: DUF3606 domain-containing protein [Usitatibacter sp.]|jgi:hypothetical protein|nr:DUF3606 domain-containing protein [Usitatibacter sp.]